MNWIYISNSFRVGLHDEWVFKGLSVVYDSDLKGSGIERVVSVKKKMKRIQLGV